VYRGSSNAFMLSSKTALSGYLRAAERGTEILISPSTKKLAPVLNGCKIASIGYLAASSGEHTLNLCILARNDAGENSAVPND